MHAPHGEQAELKSNSFSGVNGDSPPDIEAVAQGTTATLLEERRGQRTTPVCRFAGLPVSTEPQEGETTALPPNGGHLPQIKQSTVRPKYFCINLVKNPIFSSGSLVVFSSSIATWPAQEQECSRSKIGRNTC